MRMKTLKTQLKQDLAIEIDLLNKGAYSCEDVRMGMAVKTIEILLVIDGEKNIAQKFGIYYTLLDLCKGVTRNQIMTLIDEIL